MNGSFRRRVARFHARHPDLIGLEGSSNHEPARRRSAAEARADDPPGSIRLIGAVLDAADEEGRTITVRIDAVTRDPSDLDGDIWLHRFSVPDATPGGWREFCPPGPDGTIAGFPLAGVWTSDGRHEHASPSLTITCTSGAIGKCVRLGYRPWGEVGGESLWDSTTKPASGRSEPIMVATASATRATGHWSTFSIGSASSRPSLIRAALPSNSRPPGAPTVLSASAERAFLNSCPPTTSPHAIRVWPARSAGIVLRPLQPCCGIDPDGVSDAIATTARVMGEDGVLFRSETQHHQGRGWNKGLILLH
jgi:hypothetical protein